ncbi:MAG: hypothetical protein CMK59_09625 [Proteobacteria bacterium]|nr:hypothetical protein [Pseudomonadota bacterium]
MLRGFSIRAYHQGTELFSLNDLKVNEESVNRIDIRTQSEFVMGDLFVDGDKVAFFELWPTGISSVQLGTYGRLANADLKLEFENNQNNYWGLGSSDLNGSTIFQLDSQLLHPDHFGSIFDSSTPRTLLLNSETTRLLSSTTDAFISENRDYFNGIFSTSSTEQLLQNNNKMQVPTDLLLLPWLNIHFTDTQTTQNQLEEAQNLGPIGVVITHNALGGWQEYPEDFAELASSQSYKWIVHLESSFETNTDNADFAPLLHTQDNTLLTTNNNVHLDLNSPALKSWIAEHKERLKQNNVDGWSSELQLDELYGVTDDDYLQLKHLWNSFLIEGESLLVGSNVLQSTIPTFFTVFSNQNSDSNAINISMSGFPYQIKTHNEHMAFDQWEEELALATFSPLMNVSWPSFSDTESIHLEAWNTYASERARLLPYLKTHSEMRTLGITPPETIHHDWNILNCWMLGSELIIIPNGAEEQQLPSSSRWYNYWTEEPVEMITASSESPLPLVLIPQNSIVPTLEIPPISADADELNQTDSSRVLKLFGAQGHFTEADGTTYSFNSSSSTAIETEFEVQEGNLELNGLTIEISGPKLRNYIIRYTP